MAASRSNWPRPAQAPSLDDLSRCVHCGLCITSCPTYLVTGLETESPRGRIHLARAVHEQRLEITPAVQAHWELCLQCRACEAVCPSSVPYGRIIERIRVQLAADSASRSASTALRRFVLRHVVARPRALMVVLAPIRWYAALPVRGLIRRSGALRVLGRLGAWESQLPDRPGPPLRAGDVLMQPERSRGQAVLFTGCVMSELFGDVHRATGRVLARNGIAATAPAGQACCGALHAHDGDFEFARKLARNTIDFFQQHGDTPVVVTSAGCGAAMKEYGDLLNDDSAYAEPARAFSSRVRDLTEYLVALGGEIPAELVATVTYQDPCHLAHAQRITDAPRQLLRAVRGCSVVETPEADVCCGAAGLYGLVNPGMSAQLRSRKAEQLRTADPEVVVTANPGCHLQLQSAVREAGIAARVVHIAELLDEAYARAGADRSPVTTTNSPPHPLSRWLLNRLRLRR